MVVDCASVIKLIGTTFSRPVTHNITRKEEKFVQSDICIVDIGSCPVFYPVSFQAMVMGESVEAGTPPPDLSGQEISFVPGVLLDSPPPGHHFGDCLVEPPMDVFPGNTVSATFVSGVKRST